MIRGLVIGKFLPLHTGHVALIRFAKSQCDELIVSISVKPDDPIDYRVRLRWLRETFSGEASIQIEWVEDNFDNESLPLFERTALWARFVSARFPKVHRIFSSEEYGEPFATHLGVSHFAFDPSRAIVPVSGKAIRPQPLAHWDFLPSAVKPYYVKKVCFYGPESTGKSVMATRMAEEYDTVAVPEVAREMILSNDFSVADIIRIGNAQTQRVLELETKANRILICDTDLITTEIYSQQYLKQIPNELFELERKIQYDRYLLFDIDVPWVADGLRDLSNQRGEMFAIFRTELEKRSIPYVLVNGDWESRVRIVRRVIDELLTSQAPNH